jgi:copper chaperone CopZ
LREGEQFPDPIAGLANGLRVCAHAVRVSLMSVNGVASVDVSLDKALAAVKLKPGNSVTLKQLQGALSKNGLTIKQSRLTAARKMIPA